MTRGGRRDTEAELYALLSGVRALVLGRARSKQEQLDAMQGNLRRFQTLQTMNEERLREAQERGKASDVRFLSAAVRAMTREIERERAIIGGLQVSSLSPALGCRHTEMDSSKDRNR